MLLWKIPFKNTKTISSLKHELLEGKPDLPGTPVYIVYTNDIWCSFRDKKTKNKAYFIFGWVRHKNQQTFLTFSYFFDFFLKFFLKKFDFVWVRHISIIKGTVSVISNDPPCIDGNVRFTFVPLKPLTDHKMVFE